MEPFEKNNYFHLVADIDKVLSGLHVLLQLAATPEGKAKVRQSINIALDQRLEFMKSRDAVGQTQVPL